MSSIHKHGELNCSHPAEVDQGPEGRADRASCIENIVDEDDVLVVDVRGYFGPSNHGLRRNFGQVVPIKIDVEHPHLRRLSGPVADVLRHPLGHRDAPALNAQQHHVTPCICRHDLIGQMFQRATHFTRRHELIAQLQCHGRRDYMLNSVSPMSQAPDLTAEFAGIRLKNPVIAASGTFGYGEEFKRFVDLNRIGAVVVKGTSARAMAGNQPPRLFPTASGMINSIGLENVGVDAFVRDKMPALREVGCSVFVNVFGFAEEEYAEVIDKLNECEGITAYELNISCPNTKHGGMTFGTNAQLTHSLTKMLKARSRRPLIVKMSPNVTDIAELARAAEDAGADALTVANTYLAMAIDTDTFMPRIHTVTGGLSGPAIKPITLRLVYQCVRAVKIPVIGLGGIFSAEDAVEYLLAGACAVQIGTANFQDPRAPVRILDGLEKFMAKRAMASLKDVIGKMKS